MALKWNFYCLPGSGRYTGREVRFALDYSSFPSAPIISNKVRSLKGFVNNSEKRRISILVNPDSVIKCDLSTNLKTEDPIAEFLYNQFINDNIPLFGSYQEVQKYIRFYCFDTKGLDVPFIPNSEEIKSKTGISELVDSLKLLGIPLGLGLAIYTYSKFYKPNRRKRK